MPFGASIVAAAAGLGSLGAAAMTNKGNRDTARAQGEQNAAEREFILQQTNQARDMAGKIYDSQASNAMLGGRAALDVLRGAYGSQAGIYDQSANNAMAAILGGQINPYTIDQSYLNVQMPNYQTAGVTNDVYGPKQSDSVSGGVALGGFNGNAIKELMLSMRGTRGRTRPSLSINDKIVTDPTAKQRVKNFF